MKKIDIICVIVICLLFVGHLFIIANKVTIIDNTSINKIRELEYRIEVLESDMIIFENAHADHYSFEEYTILKYLPADKAREYKHYLDSIQIVEKRK